MRIRKRLYFLLVLISMIIMAGSTGYYIIFKGEPKFLDCIYMTVVSLTTVGYGEVLNVTGNDTAQIFTMLLITFGMGVILYGISSLTALFLEGELSGILRKKRMANRQRGDYRTVQKQPGGCIDRGKYRKNRALRGNM